MHTEVMKWASILALLLALLFWPSTATYQLELGLVVTTGAAVVLVQAYQAKNYGLAAGFLGIAVLFNPVLPVFHLTGVLSLYLLVLAITPFAMSLIALHPKKLLSIPSITGRNPGSQSL
jgi:hypothetical protein